MTSFRTFNNSKKFNRNDSFTFIILQLVPTNDGILHYNNDFHLIVQMSESIFKNKKDLVSTIFVLHARNGLEAPFYRVLMRKSFCHSLNLLHTGSLGKGAVMVTGCFLTGCSKERA